MSNQRKRERAKEIERIFAEGAQAYRDGKHRQQNPYRNMNMLHWAQGYECAQQEDQARNEIDE